MTSLFQKEKTVNRVVLLDVSEILPNPAQPRTSFDPDSLASLAQSIRQNGVLQPVTVRKNRKGRYELIAGERRKPAKRIQLSWHYLRTCSGRISTSLNRQPPFRQQL